MEKQSKREGGRGIQGGRERGSSQQQGSGNDECFHHGGV